MLKCLHCGSTSFRTSRFRPADLPRLLLFQYPVRCRTCRERDFAGLMLAMNLHQAGKIRRQEESHRKSKEGTGANRRSTQ